MTAIRDLQETYEALDIRLDMAPQEDINASLLLCFDYEYEGQESEIAIDTNEFTAVCPWTGLPDQGTLVLTYVPDKLCLELKAVKYYLLSYRNVGIVQEHAANRMLRDFTEACRPLRMTVDLDYQVRGGLHTRVTASYSKPAYD